MPHVPARLVGHGLVVAPRPGSRLERVDGAPETTLRVTHGDETTDVDLLTVARDGSAPLDVTEAGPPGAWRIQTAVYTCTWPHGLAIGPEDGASPFLLLGKGTALVWVNGPMPRAKATPIENLVGEDQRVRAVAQQGENQRIDLDYEEEGEKWWQRRYALVWGEGRVLIVSAQAVLEDEDAARAGVDELAATLEPYRPS